MIRQQLQRNNVDNRRKQRVDFRHFNYSDLLFVLESGFAVSQDVKMGTTSSNLLNIRLDFLQQIIGRCNRHDRHIAID